MIRWFFFRLDPIITNVPASGVKLSSVTFAKNSEVNATYDFKLYLLNFFALPYVISLGL